MPDFLAPDSLSRLLLIPGDTFVKLNTIAAKAIQSAANGQIYAAVAKLLDQFQVVKVPAAAGICDRDRAPFGKPSYQLLVNAPLQALVVGSMDEKLGAVRLQRTDGIYCFGVRCM